MRAKVGLIALNVFVVLGVIAALALAEGDGDTGRMSEAEYELLTSFDSEVFKELDDWRRDLPMCRNIGMIESDPPLAPSGSQAGKPNDVVGFRACLDNAYRGLREDEQRAVSYAKDTRFGRGADSSPVF